MHRVTITGEGQCASWGMHWCNEHIPIKYKNNKFIWFHRISDDTNLNKYPYPIRTGVSSPS